MKQEISVDLSGGKRLSFETGKLAKQAHGSVVVRMGDNVVLATATSNPEPREGIDFFPLTVDYREYTYAGGRIPGGFIKREGRPSEREILTSRQIDRPVRPLFQEGFKCETQVIAFVLSADTENDPDVAGINGASAALTISDIPFLGPIGAVRVGLVNGQFIVNPTYSEMGESLLNIMVVGTSEGIVMIESGAKEVKEETVVDAIEFAHAEIKKICAAINELRSKAGKPKREVTPPEFDQAYYDKLKKKIGADLTDRLDTEKHPKAESYQLVRELKKQLEAEIPEDDDEARAKLKTYYETLRERIFREAVTHQKRRPDGRAFDQIRDISIEVGVLPRTHGSAIFTRGETQALVTTTLGTSDDMQRLERFEGETKKRFMLHYNFPPFSVGEVAFLRGAGRREIGHGALAERAISAVLPAEDKWPYAMRVVSDILESNGSSSMATVFGAALSLMDEVLTTHREKVSAYAARTYTLQIPVDKIRDVIGPGGKMIRSIIERTGVKIDVEDTGKVNVASNDETSANQALQIIRDLTATAEVGKTYLGKVTRLADFGAFVEIIPGTEGLLHISEAAEHRIKDVRDELKEGDQVLVKVLAVEGNRIRLSRKAILKEQRAKMGGGELPPENGGGESGGGEAAHAPALTIEGGADFADDEPNFNRDASGAAAPAGDRGPERGGDRPDRGGDRGRRPGGGGGGGRGRGRGGPGRGGRGG